MTGPRLTSDQLGVSPILALPDKLKPHTTRILYWSGTQIIHHDIRRWLSIDWLLLKVPLGKDDHPPYSVHPTISTSGNGTVGNDSMLCPKDIQSAMILRIDWRPGSHIYQNCNVVYRIISAENLFELIIQGYEFVCFLGCLFELVVTSLRWYWVDHHHGWIRHVSIDYYSDPTLLIPTDQIWSRKLRHYISIII